MFAREGIALIVTSVLIGAALAVAAKQAGSPWGWAFAVPALLIPAFTLWFFRDPPRTPPADTSNLVLAPADGKVVVIQEVHEPLYIQGPALQVSIFLSPLNVHVNRAPADGTIEYDDYVPGEYLVAWHEKASELNERSQLGLLHPSGKKILFKQIAGAVARRIVYHIGVGDTVTAGERFGIVKFGSRMDVLMPPGTPLDVALGDRVVAGETILARLHD
ncbi:MAG: phosphatidylserine decarboxylase family protein [Bacteroidetes bacterium CG12_big_fil_rev_8_21_14_0_65_60_17]|nr:MAG: phosphatidylserine decarboxylase family protein [Bacteroidetes bacterium CG12_big_fil_rev_8_21_14_0_65_60_17]